MQPPKGCQPTEPLRLDSHVPSPTTGVQRVAEYAEQTLDLPNAHLSDDYFYQSVPLCV